jgi:hypothetical protein
MPLCIKCRRSEATIHFKWTVEVLEKVNVHLCETCARPAMERLEASRQGRQQCEFCGGAAFNPLPAVLKIIYACCGCRADYARIFFDICAVQRPDLVARSKNDISFFDMVFDTEVEDWSATAGKEAIQKLRTLFNRGERSPSAGGTEPGNSASA